MRESYVVFLDAVSGRCLARIASNPSCNDDESPEVARSSQFSFPRGKRDQFGDGVGRICEKSCTSACLP